VPSGRNSVTQPTGALCIFVPRFFASPKHAFFTKLPDTTVPLSLTKKKVSMVRKLFATLLLTGVLLAPARAPETKDSQRSAASVPSADFQAPTPQTAGPGHLSQVSAVRRIHSAAAKKEPRPPDAATEPWRSASQLCSSSSRL